MKRIFRSTKSPIDPLPPPQQPSNISNPSSGRSTPHHQGARSITALFGGGDSNDNSPGHEHKWGFSLHHHSEVTPFPAEVGADAVPPPGSAKRKDKSITAPSLLEIKQMQEKGSQAEEARRRAPSQPIPPPLQQTERLSKAYQSSPSPDEWQSVPSQTQNQNGGYDTYAQPLPVPNASFSQSPTNSNSSTASGSAHNTIFLPPGARPPTPPSARPPYPLHMRYSQSNLHNSTTPGNEEEAAVKSGRERGYSSPASAVAVAPQSDQNHSSKLTKATRSPLSHAYATVDLPDPPTFPSPKPYTPGISTPTPNNYSRRGSSPVEGLPNPFSPIENIPIGPNSEVHTIPNQRDEHPPELKEKKRFWGMGIRSDKKSKAKAQAEREHAVGHGQMQVIPQGDWRPSVDGSRGSIDAWRDSESRSTSVHGHPVQFEEEPRGRLLGLDFGRKDHTATQMNDVTSAIRGFLLCNEKNIVLINHSEMLAASSDPSSVAIYEVCDRINHSDSSESVSKEAARALRKEFKHGNELERRNAAKLWLLLMRNVTVKGFRRESPSPSQQTRIADKDIAYGSNKKFFQSLEPILFAPSSKPIVSPSTHRLLTDVIADLTFSYGMEKGCEMLVDVWKKVKLSQESDYVRHSPNQTLQTSKLTFILQKGAPSLSRSSYL